MSAPVQATTVIAACLIGIAILALSIATIFWQFGYRPEPAPTPINIQLPTR